MPPTEQTPETVSVKREEVPILHEATLRDLLLARNYSVIDLLWERNRLLEER